MDIRFEFEQAWITHGTYNGNSTNRRGRLAWNEVAERVEARIGYFYVYDPARPELVELAQLSRRVRRLLNRRYEWKARDERRAELLAQARSGVDLIGC